MNNGLGFISKDSVDDSVSWKINNKGTLRSICRGRTISDIFALVVAPGTCVVHTCVRTPKASLLMKREERHQVGFAPRGEGPRREPLGSNIKVENTSS